MGIRESTLIPMQSHSHPLLSKKKIRFAPLPPAAKMGPLYQDCRKSPPMRDYYD